MIYILKVFKIYFNMNFYFGLIVLSTIYIIFCNAQSPYTKLKWSMCNTASEISAIKVYDLDTSPMVIRILAHFSNLNFRHFDKILASC